MLTRLQLCAILICGDIAFSGRKAEYEEKPKVFISDLLTKMGYENEQVFMVPGNHDKNRDAEDGNMSGRSPDFAKDSIAV